jgi:hypothetical protein
MDEVEERILVRLQVGDKLEHHLQILSAEADMEACPPLWEVEGVWVG